MGRPRLFATDADRQRAYRQRRSAAALPIAVNRISVGDCAALMRDLPDNIVDLTVTSPPYDNLRKYRGYTFDFDAIAAELYRVTKPGGVVVWVVADATVNGCETGSSFRQALEFIDLGFRLHDTMIYHRLAPPSADNGRYQQHFEFMYVLSKGKPRTTNISREPSRHAGKSRRIRSTARHHEKQGGPGLVVTTQATKPLGNVWQYRAGWMKSSADAIAFEHPAIFPEALAADHILSWSNPDDLVFDPMCGSGTTPKMAKLHGRNYLGMDISEEYVRIAERRCGDLKISGRE